MGGTSPFNPNSPQAHAISTLFIITLLIAGLILALVTGLVVWSAVRYRRRAGQPEPRQVAGNRYLEIGWTLAPALVLVGISWAAFNTMGVIDPPANRQPDIIVRGYQWWWQVEYPQKGVTTANEIHIPTGKQILLQIEAADVIHDFWVPQLGPKRDMIPGTKNYLWVAADTPGVFEGACAEFCGAQHARMRIRVVAQGQAEFDAWQQGQAAAAAVPTAGVAAQGAQLFGNLTCANCHAIAGTAAQARVGPDLTHVASRQTLGAGVIQNTPANLSSWIVNPHAIKPGVLMPGFQLPNDQVQQLVAYLETLK